MKKNVHLLGTLLLLSVLLAGCDDSPQPAKVDTQRVLAADGEPGNWLVHGRTYDEQRFSPLTAINAGNVTGLGLAWYRELGTDRGLEGAPIVVDGVMYIGGAWNNIYAMDARTGEQLWHYDPQTSRAWVAALKPGR